MKNEGEIYEIIKKNGLPKNIEELRMVTEEERYKEFIEVLKNAS